MIDSICCREDVDGRATREDESPFQKTYGLMGDSGLNTDRQILLPGVDGGHI